MDPDRVIQKQWTRRILPRTMRDDEEEGSPDASLLRSLRCSVLERQPAFLRTQHLDLEASPNKGPESRCTTGSYRCTSNSEAAPAAAGGIARRTVIKPETRMPIDMITAETISDCPRIRKTRPFLLFSRVSDMPHDSVVRDFFGPSIDPRRAGLDPLSS